MSAVLRSTKQYQTTMKKAMPTEINESQVLDIWRCCGFVTCLKFRWTLLYCNKTYVLRFSGFSGRQINRTKVVIVVIVSLFAFGSDFECVILSEDSVVELTQEATTLIEPTGCGM